MSFGWRDLITQVQSHGGTAGPAWVKFRDGIYLYAFPCNSPREVLATFHIGHDYEMGSPLYPHFHFTVNDRFAEGNVRIGFEYTIAKGHQQETGSIFDNTKIVFTDTKVNSAKSDRFKHFVAEVSDKDAIPGVGIEPDTIILMRIFRDANCKFDTFPADIFGITADLHYLAAQHATPNKSPDFFNLDK
jgi:hypothetical protein